MAHNFNQVLLSFHGKSFSLDLDGLVLPSEEEIFEMFLSKQLSTRQSSTESSQFFFSNYSQSLDTFPLFLRINLRNPAGKGGFGALLKDTRLSKKLLQNLDYSLCVNADGQKLAHIKRVEELEKKLNSHKMNPTDSLSVVKAKKLQLQQQRHDAISARLSAKTENASISLFNALEEAFEASDGESGSESDDEEENDTSDNESGESENDLVKDSDSENIIKT